MHIYKSTVLFLPIFYHLTCVTRARNYNDRFSFDTRLPRDASSWACVAQDTPEIPIICHHKPKKWGERDEGEEEESRE